MYYRSSLIFVFSFLGFIALGQKSKLLAGPTVGEVTPEKAIIWFAYKGEGNHSIYLKNTSNNLLSVPDSVTNLTIDGKVSAKAYFSALQPETKHKIIIHIAGWGFNTGNFIHTLSDSNELKDFNYLFGSCNLITAWPFKAFWPGFKIRILKNMCQENSDFMLWLGDNTYYLGKDYLSQKNMFNRQLKYRQKHKQLNRFLANQPNYSIWDDHDFGPNDSNGNFELKEQSLEVYKSFWPNPSFGLDTLPGVFFTFNYEDAQFFMTDNRYYQTDLNIENPSLFGKEQLQWLKNELLKSNATFKIVSIGSQVISTINTHESFENFIEEKMELLNFISENDIEGVMFLSGDRHISDVNIIRREGKYSLYDFTSSPMLSPGSLIVGKIDKVNPDRLDGALIKRRNYAKMSFSGEEGNRIVQVNYYNVNGKQIRSYHFHESEFRNN